MSLIWIAKRSLNVSPRVRLVADEEGKQRQEHMTQRWQH